jgi:hypothetical protein
MGYALNFYFQFSLQVDDVDETAAVANYLHRSVPHPIWWSHTVGRYCTSNVYCRDRQRLGSIGMIPRRRWTAFSLLIADIDRHLDLLVLVSVSMLPQLRRSAPS